MQDNLDATCKQMLHWEGGWTSNPRDPGGPTMEGVTLRVYAAWCAAQGRDAPDANTLRNIPMADVEAIFEAGYWHQVNGDHLPPGLDYATVDFAYNSGPGTALRKLREVLGLPSSSGPLSEQEIGILWDTSSPGAAWGDLVNAYCDARLDFMRNCKGGTLWPTFGKGWSNRVAGVRAGAIHMVPDDVAQYIANMTNGAGSGQAVADASANKQGKAEDDTPPEPA